MSTLTLLHRAAISLLTCRRLTSLLALLRRTAIPLLTCRRLTSLLALLYRAAIPLLTCRRLTSLLALLYRAAVPLLTCRGLTSLLTLLYRAAIPLLTCRRLMPSIGLLCRYRLLGRLYGSVLLRRRTCLNFGRRFICLYGFTLGSVRPLIFYRRLFFSFHGGCCFLNLFFFRRRLDLNFGSGLCRNFRHLFAGIGRHKLRAGLVLLSKFFLSFAFLAFLFLADKTIRNLAQRIEHFLRLLAQPRHILQHLAGIHAQFLGRVLNPDFGHSLNAPPIVD